jgi:hypothetical protein
MEQLTATIAPVNATNQNLTWSTSDGSKATVSSSGMVTAVSAGTATITVTTVDGGFTASCEVTVSTATTGAISVTATYTGSHGPVSAAKPIILCLSKADNFNGTPSFYNGITTSGGSYTISNLAPGNYQFAVALDIDGNGEANNGDSIEFYNNIGLYNDISITNIVVTAGNTQSISIEFDDTWTINDEDDYIFVFDTKTISIDGDFSDWDSITQKVDDPSGDTLGGYANDDIEYVKVAKDANNIYFLVKLYEDYSTTYNGGYDVRINGSIGSSLTQYDQFFIQVSYIDALWQGRIWANPGNPGPGPDLLSGPLASLAAVGSGAYASYMELKISLIVIGNPTIFTGVQANVLNFGYGIDVENSPSFGEQ